MKKVYTLSLTLGLFTLLFSNLALAGNKAAKGEGKADKKETRKLLKGFDKNDNGQIDGDEKEAVKKALATEPLLKPFDLNSDGTLDDTELAAIKIKTGKNGKKAK